MDRPRRPMSAWGRLGRRRARHQGEAPSSLRAALAAPSARRHPSRRRVVRSRGVPARPVASTPLLNLFTKATRQNLPNPAPWSTFGARFPVAARPRGSRRGGTRARARPSVPTAPPPAAPRCAPPAPSGGSGTALEGPEQPSSRIGAPRAHSTSARPTGRLSRIEGCTQSPERLNAAAHY